MSERTHEVQARHITAAHLIDTDEIAVLAPELPLPENHNCDAMGCGSMSHVAFRAPLDVMSQLDECEDKLREAEAELAEAQARIAELEAELADAQKTISEMQTATNILADAGINTLKSNAKLQARAEKAEAERDAARAKVEEVKGKLEVAAEWIRDYGMELCACCGRWCDMGDMITGEDGGPYCCDCYESWRFECSSTGCTYRMAELEDGADTRCPECGEVMVERCVKEGLS